MTRLARVFVGALVIVACAAWTPNEGAELVGTRAPELRGLTWIQGGPLTLAKLRGHPVLLRFWTDGCQLCHDSAPSLNALDEKYAPRGLVVIGVHHPKSDASKSPDVARRAARELGFGFPVATDPEWTTVRAFGVGAHFKSFTSVSILVDGEGTIRWVHDGGVLDLASPAGKSLVALLDRMVAKR